MVIYDVVDFEDEVKVLQLPNGKYLVDQSYLEEFKIIHKIP